MDRAPAPASPPQRARATRGDRVDIRGLEPRGGWRWWWGRRYIKWCRAPSDSVGIRYQHHEWRPASGVFHPGPTRGILQCLSSGRSSGRPSATRVLLRCVGGGSRGLLVRSRTRGAGRTRSADPAPRTPRSPSTAACCGSPLERRLWVQRCGRGAHRAQSCGGWRWRISCGFIAGGRPPHAAGPPRRGVKRKGVRDGRKCLGCSVGQRFGVRPRVFVFVCACVCVCVYARTRVEPHCSTLHSAFFRSQRSTNGMLLITIRVHLAHCRSTQGVAGAHPESCVLGF